MGNSLSFSQQKSNTFKIAISCDFNLQCSFIDKQNNERVIRLNENQEEEWYPLTISFDNTISICQKEKKENTITFINDLFNSPDDFKYYNITFQNKQYSVIAEVLLALIIKEFKHKVEKEYIIEKTIIELPMENKIMNSRIISH